MICSGDNRLVLVKLKAKFFFNDPVNCIAPGFIDTDMTKDLPEEHKTALIGQTALGRLGQTDDVANACLYLASPAGAYVTGIVLHVNGGMYMG